MEGTVEYTNPYKQRFDEVKGLGWTKLILGLFASTIIMVGSTWGLLSLLNFSGAIDPPIDSSRVVPYTWYMLAASALSIVVAFILCAILIKWPRSVSLSLSIHRYAKRHSGDYFLSPEPEDENLGVAFRRSLYGSILVVGIALTVLGFNLMTDVGTGDLLFVGSILMLVSVIILPLTIMLLYFGPWLMKDSGLFHLDEKDRSLSNVGDDVEDILEFFAGVDIILVWLELTLSVGATAPWVPIFIILVPLGPLFSIILNFTIVFMAFKKRATMSMMKYLKTRYEVPDVATSPDYIRSRVISLVDRELFFIAPSTDSIELPREEPEDVPEEETEPQPEPEPEPEPEVESKPEPKRDHIPPPPGEHVEPSEDDN
ncbi:MAG: hypothetical protein ACXABE_10260 [Candidatus Thorarchaeota archaeon]|jgi:hypothetical protein